MVQIVTISNASEYEFEIVYLGTPYKPNIFQPKVSVRYKNDIFTADVMYSKPLTKLLFKKGYTPSFGRIKSTDCIWSSSFMEDVKIYLLFFTFKVLDMLQVKIRKPKANVQLIRYKDDWRDKELYNGKTKKEYVQCAVNILKCMMNPRNLVEKVGWADEYI
eukprot:501505_1